MAPDLHPARGFAEAFAAQRLRDALALPGPVPVWALAGLPGCGKSTLVRQMAALARKQGIPVAVLSIDDFYLGRRARQQLARTVHPLLATRGPPGTHDLALAVETLDQLRQGRATRLPRFDKLGDTRWPPSRWPRLPVAPALVLFEGWFLMTPPQSAEELEKPINRLERELDADGRWRRACNAALAGYAPLWRRLDGLTLLQAPGFEVVPAWRWQQEQALAQRSPGRKGMTRSEVEGFVMGFERVGRQALRTLPAIAGRVVRLDAERRPIS